MAKLEFPIPDGWTGMDEVEVDDTKDFVATVKKKDDGTLCFVALEGVPLKYEEAEVVAAEEKTADGRPPKAETMEEKEERLKRRFRGPMYS